MDFAHPCAHFGAFSFRRVALASVNQRFKVRGQFIALYTMLHCALTGVVPEDPVISKSTGRVYERRIIEKYIETHGTDPFTNASLTKEDLISVQTKKVVPPRPLTATSIPGMLQLFQSEWDAVILESFKLKQQLDAARQELAHALYQHDAACRVIARLLKERDEARAALTQLKAASQPAEGMDVEKQATSAGSKPAGLDKTIRDQLIEYSKTLSEQRKHRKVSTTLAGAEAIGGFRELSSHPTHSAAHRGILCLALHPSKPRFMLTGGVDHNVVYFDAAAQQVVATLKGHSKRVVDVAFHPTEPLVFSASSDRTARVWAEGTGGYRTQYHVKAHAAPLVGVSVQPTGQYFATASDDNTWVFHDLLAAAALATVADATPDTGAFTRARFHPDGLIFATPTTAGLVRFWDIKSMQNVFSTPEKHAGSVSDIAFSENGYFFASVGVGDRLLKIWDLRKGAVYLSTKIDDESDAEAAISVEFDYSGSYVAASSSSAVNVYTVKTLDRIATLYGHTAAVTDIQFGPDAKFIATTSMDRFLKIWGGEPPAAE